MFLGARFFLKMMNLVNKNKEGRINFDNFSFMEEEVREMMSGEGCQDNV